MPSLRNLFALLVAAVFTLGGQAEQISPSSIKDSLRAVHGALYSAFIPIDELKQDSRLHALFVENRENIWRENSSLALSRLLAPFADLRGFGTSCGIRTFLRPEGAGSFAALTRSEREHVLFLLATCNESVPRRLASTVRNFYVAKAYGAMQEQLTGIHINLSAPHDWIEQHRPQLPPTRLHYDAKTHEVVSADTPFDYLIVGSGPAGSVLAHELRRGGNHVLLVERGSFIVPGSMESRQVEDLIDARTSDDGGIIIHNGMAVGGGSQVNVDLGFSPLLPSVQAKIDLWRREGLIGPDDFNKEQLASAYEWVRSAIGTRTLSQSEINANNRVLWEGALRAGRRRPRPLPRGRCLGRAVRGRLGGQPLRRDGDGRRPAPGTVNGPGGTPEQGRTTAVPGAGAHCGGLAGGPTRGSGTTCGLVADRGLLGQLLQERHRAHGTLDHQVGLCGDPVVALGVDHGDPSHCHPRTRPVPPRLRTPGGRRGRRRTPPPPACPPPTSAPPCPCPRRRGAGTRATSGPDGPAARAGPPLVPRIRAHAPVSGAWRQCRVTVSPSARRKCRWGPRPGPDRPTSVITGSPGRASGPRGPGRTGR